MAQSNRRTPSSTGIKGCRGHGRPPESRSVGDNGCSMLANWPDLGPRRLSSRVREVSDERSISRFIAERSRPRLWPLFLAPGSRNRRQARRQPPPQGPGRRHAHRTASQTSRGYGPNATITPSNGRAILPARRFSPKRKRPTWRRERRRNAVDRPPSPGDTGTYNQFWFDRGTKVVGTRRTSLVVRSSGRQSTAATGSGSETRRRPCAQRRLV